MTKSDLVFFIAARNPHLSYQDVENIVNTVLGDMSDALVGGDRVELRGFGTFSVRHRLSHTGRNPRTGESVFVEEKWVPHFKTGKELHRLLNTDIGGVENDEEA